MPSIHTRRTVLRTIGLGVGGLAVSGGTASAASHGPVTVFTYDPALGELPENIAIDRRGTKYVSFPPRGEIREITPDNQHESTIGTFDIGSGNGVIGLEVTPSRELYACLITQNTGTADTHGIWRRSRKGDWSLFAALPADTFPNDILLDQDSLLVTDSIGGAVLQVEEGGWMEWATGQSLTGTGAAGLGFPIGANGIARGSDGTVYVANTERGQIVEIPVESDGSAGTPEVFVNDSRLFASDGLAMDVRDNIYVGVIGQDTVVRVSTGGDIETLATAADVLDGPSDVTFGTTRGEQKDLFITNFALLSMDSPSLMKLDVGIPGRPIRQ